MLLKKVHFSKVTLKGTKTYLFEGGYFLKKVNTFVLEKGTFSEVGEVSLFIVKKYL